MKLAKKSNNDNLKMIECVVVNRAIAVTQFPISMKHAMKDMICIVADKFLDYETLLM